MKFKIPEIKITPSETNKAGEDTAPDDAGEILDELEHAAPDDYSAQQPLQAAEAQDAPAFTVSEGQLRKVWAGEIVFGLLASFAAILIALVG